MDLLLLVVLFSSSEAVIFSPIWFAKRIDDLNKPKSPVERIPHRFSKPVHLVCTTSDCKNAAGKLLTYMNLTVDPCVDFYEFACGGWAKANPIPSTESSWGQFDVAAEVNYFQIKDILEENVIANEPTPVTAMKVVYRSCIKKDLSDTKENVLPLLDLMSTMGNGWPIIYGSQWTGEDFVWYEVAADIISNFQSSSLISVFVNYDRKNTSNYIITIDQPAFVLSREMLIKPSPYKKHIEAYKSFIINSAWILAKSVGNSEVSRKSIIDEVEELIAFEFKLAQIASPQEMRRNVIRTYNAMTLYDLQEWSNSGAIDQIDWLKFIRRLTRNFNYTIDWTERVIVREADFVFELMQLLQSTPARVIANYMHWRVVRTFSSDLTTNLRQLAFEFKKAVTGAKNEQPLWKECVDVVYSALNMALGYSYVQKHFDNSTKSVAVQMSENIKSAFSERLDKMNWMDEETRRKARHKIAAMTSHIGYPSWFSNLTLFESYYEGLEVFPESYFNNVISSSRFMFFKNFNKLRTPVDRDEWVSSPAEVNAFYNPAKNTIIFPAAILQPPFFTKGRIEALNYGGIGVIIGHEITHAFDDTGRQFDAEGNMAPWWTEKTTTTYMNKSKCFTSQYNSYSVPELEGTPEPKVNGAITLGENIADNGGLRAALAAYRKYVLANGPEPILPGLEKYNAEQLFFISSATNWCETSTKEALIASVLSDPHSPNRFRVLGTIQNSDDFSRVFSCPKVKIDKCVMW